MHKIIQIQESSRAILEKREGGSHNENNVRELGYHAENNRDLYKTSHVPIAQNLEKKFRKGTYDHEKAKKAWQHHYNRAADSYAKEFGHKGAKGHQIFSVADRKEAARRHADYHKNEMELGNFHGNVKEETIQEISKKKLEKYVGDANDVIKNMPRSSDEYKKSKAGRAEAVKKLGLQKYYGVDGLAKVKATNEENIQELSAGLMGNYVKAAQAKQKQLNRNAIRNAHSREKMEKDLKAAQKKNIAPTVKRLSNTIQKNKDKSIAQANKSVQRADSIHLADRKRVSKIGYDAVKKALETND